MLDALLDDLLGAVAALVVVGEEDVADRVVVTERDAELFGLAAQEGIGLLHEQAAAVAGLAVGGDRTTVGHAIERRDRGLNQLVARLIVHVRDQAETAGVLLELGTVETVGGVAFERRFRALGH